MVESLDIDLAPVFLTSVTTAIGFMTLNFSDAPAFAHLGNISALGVMIAFVLSVTFLPALLYPQSTNCSPGTHGADLPG